MLRPSFVPPVEIRELRDYTRLRADLTRERTRHWQRLEKLLEDALIKVSTVATDILAQSGAGMLEALIAGERDPKVLAELARAGCGPSGAALSRGADRPFRRPPRRTDPDAAGPDRHAHRQIDTLTARIEQLLTAHPRRRRHRAAASDPTPATAPTAPLSRGCPPRRDHRDRHDGGADHHRRGRPGYEPVPHRRAPGFVGQALPTHHPVRDPQPDGQDRQRQPVPQRCARRSRRRRRQDRHLPRRALPAAGQTPRQAQGPRRASPGRSWSSSGTCSPTQPPASTISVSTSTPERSTRSAAPATSSTSSRSSATTSPSPPPPEHTTPPTRCTAGGSPQRAHLRASPSVIFGSVIFGSVRAPVPLRGPVSPSPFQSVRAVFPHTAYR